MNPLCICWGWLIWWFFCKLLCFVCCSKLRSKVMFVQKYCIWFSSSGSSRSNRIHWLPWPSWCKSKHYCNPSLVRVWISVTLIPTSIFPSLLGCWWNSRPQRGQRRKGKHLCNLFSKLTNDVSLKRKSVIPSQSRLLWNPASGKTAIGPSDW